ncbi:O-Glycosyl hydrolase family 30 [Poriferisphaera corsica]|uniref:O-Glycosyl hydrolase family 30 n=1 Tax=Poriferisphaera corsica TaxID=2528020 RepID=A0A517YSL9_9BACT|nr:glycoside hydrolase family 30 protein [Poriferisphaera corsica]QDU33235.1 O-Glycosyl hydrolase family 30 [Poriferisphaera corsica]
MTQVTIGMEKESLVGRAEVYLTAKDTKDRLTQKCVESNKVEGDVVPIVVKKNVTYQEIEGFGGAFTEATAYTLSRMPKELRDQAIAAYFDEENGHKYNLCRTHINSCDFALGNYAYTEVDGDVDFEHWSLERDHEYLIPLIKDAMSVSEKGFKLFASPWSPPAWMKTNGKMNHGGKLKAEHGDTWARYIAKYVRDYETLGIPIWGLSVQNEPAAVQTWDSCIYESEDERDFVRDHLGPVLEKEGLDDKKLIVWDHNRDYLFERASTILDDPEAAKYIWGVGFHWYCNGNFENLSMTQEAYPNVKLLFTEGCQEGGPHIGSWDIGERYGYNMINDLNNHTVGWVDWNLVLDETGGPNHVGNLCSAPIIADTEKQELIFQSSYYYIGHFSRFIEAGAKRVLCSTCDREIHATAMVNPDGECVVVVMNQKDEAKAVELRGVSDEMIGFELPAHSIATFVMK